MTQQEWLEQGETLAAKHDGHQWQIADWLLAGLPLFGDGTRHVGCLTEMYDAAERIFPQYERETLRKFVQAAQAFPAGTRVLGLKFGHHRVVASLPETVGAEWLKQAAAGKWSVARLRLNIMDANAPAPEPVDAPTTDAPTADATPKSPIKTKPAVDPYEYFFRLPLRSGHRGKLAELAQLYKMSPESLMARVVDHFLETHADDLAAWQRFKQDKDAPQERENAEAWAAQYRRRYGTADPEQIREVKAIHDAADKLEQERREAKRRAFDIECKTRQRIEDEKRAADRQAVDKAVAETLASQQVDASKLAALQDAAVKAALRQVAKDAERAAHEAAAQEQPTHELVPA